MNADELIDGYLDETLDEAGFAEFQQALASDPEFARRFASACADDAILQELVAGAGVKAAKRPGAVPSTVEAAGRRARTARLLSARRSDSWAPLAAAAAVILGFAFWLALDAPRRSTDHRQVAGKSVREWERGSVRASKGVDARTLQPSHSPTRPDAPTLPPSHPPTSPGRPEVPEAPSIAASTEPAPVPASPPPPVSPPPAPVIAKAPPVAPVVPPESVKPGPPPVPETEAVAAVAVLREIRGRVAVVSPSGRSAATPGRKLGAEEGVETEEAGASAAVEFPDGTRVRLAGSTRLAAIFVQPAATGGSERRVRLDGGTLTADVARQAAGDAFVFVSPHAEARVLGTRLKLTVTDAATRLDVEQGRVRLTRTRDGASVEVPAGMYAAAEPAGDFRLRSEHEQTLSFQDGVSPTPRYEGTRDAEIQGISDRRKNNYGKGTQIQVDGISPDQDGERSGLFRWDLSAIPPGSRVLRAEIGFFVLNDPHGSASDVHALLQPWEEDDATWLVRAGKTPWQKPGAAGELERGAEILGRPAPKGKGAFTAALDDAGVSAVQGWIDRPATNFGMIVANPKTTDALGVATRETREPARRPRLTVVFVPPARPR